MEFLRKPSLSLTEILFCKSSLVYQPIQIKKCCKDSPFFKGYCSLSMFFR